MGTLKLAIAGCLAATCFYAGVALGQSRPLLLTGADLYTVSHGVISQGQLLVVDGRIAALGSEVEAPADAVRIDLPGKRIYPGLIAANTVLGLNAVSSVRASLDTGEIGTNNAGLQGEMAVNPDADAWAVTRANGILSALVVPQSDGGAVLAGQSALLRTNGWNRDDMVVRSEVGLHLQWPQPAGGRWAAGTAGTDQIEKIFADARAYAGAKDQAHPADRNLDALAKVLKRKEPLLIHAETALQIRQVLAFVRRQQIDAVLVGGRDAWRLADSLAEQKIPVILGTAHRLPGRRWEGYDVVYSAASKLALAGVEVVIANDGSPTAERNLPYQAATYGAYGLGAEAALRAITLTPAEVFGVAERLGSLEAGKAATLFVSGGDILDLQSNVERAWIDGKEVSLDNHQTRLRDLYQRKYEGQTK